jgi:NodT family efflux transporter outer membrane factor (OMF) lipoprotein
MLRQGMKSIFLILFLQLLGAFLGCTLGPNFEHPEKPPVQRYTEGVEPSVTVAAEGHVQRFQYGAEIGKEWWRLFGSEELNGMVKTAIAENQTLQAAQARLRQSREILNAGYGAFFPQADGNFSITRQKFPSARFGGSFETSIFTLYTAAATVSYDFDLFGRTRRTVESLQAQVDYQQYEMDVTYLSLVGNIVNASIAQAGYQAQIEANRRIVEFEREQLKITEAQADAGVIPYSDVYSVRSLLAGTEAALPLLEKQLSRSRHLLASLVGRAPGQWSPPSIHLDELSLPPEVPVSLPSVLVRQRPDIMAAESSLHVASANIGVATAAMFPSITLSADYGQASTNFGNLFKGISNYWDYGGSITGPIFHGGSLWFQRKAAIEAYQESMATYRQTVLDAFTQVADALRALEYDALALQAQSLALKSADDSLRSVKANYQAGVANYLDLLVADRLYRVAEVGYIQALVLRLQDTSALFVALGGGGGGVSSKK